MKNIGITGVNGFVGIHLKNTLNLFNNKFNVVDFNRSFFLNQQDLDSFVEKCDFIVHLAGLNRHEDQQVIYDTNVNISLKLINSIKRVKKDCHVIMSSSTQEKSDNLYGKSKKKSRELFINWSKESNYGKFTGLIIPNIFGPFGLPNYNSVVATFCNKLLIGETPQIIKDNQVNLIYVGELVTEIIKCINKNESDFKKIIEPSFKIKVSNLLTKLSEYNDLYFLNGNIPLISSDFELNLFNTFRSYINFPIHFPVKLIKKKDNL